MANAQWKMTRANSPTTIPLKSPEVAASGLTGHMAERLAGAAAGLAIIDKSLGERLVICWYTGSTQALHRQYTGIGSEYTPCVMPVRCL
jgi:hypothetical protein